MLTRVETTLDGVNAELDKVEEITGSVAEMVKVAEQLVTGVYGAVSKPVAKSGGIGVGCERRVFVVAIW